MTDIITDDAADGPDGGLPFTVEISPDQIEPGGEVVLTALVAAEHVAELEGSLVVFFDDEANEVGRGALTDSFAGTRRSEPVELIAPERPGPHSWSAVLAIPTEDAVEVLGETNFDLVIAAHPIALALWDVPPAVTPGGDFQVKLGIKCPCGCDSTGWGWRVSDAAGHELATGSVGEAIWPGTTGLRFAEVQLTAPDALGAREWRVTAIAPEHEIAHAERSLPLRVEVRPAADATLIVEAVDAATGRPVERLKVTAHPYRAMTDAEGRAVLRLPGGQYTVFVSGRSYFAVKRTVDIAADLTLRAELHLDREVTHADNWG